jgi:hypothetical protein
MITILPKITKWTEILGIILSFGGVAFKILHLAGANEVLMLGMMTLSTTYFISGFIMMPVPDNGKPKSFADLLPTVLRKLIYIGLAVYLVGFLFAILHLEGTNEMLIIGVGSLIICTAVSMILILGNRERMTLLKAPLIRSVVALLLLLLILLIFYPGNS